MPAILVTRPIAASEPLAAILQNLGYVAVIEPLLSIKATHQPRPQVEKIDAVMITSSNALAALKESDVADLFAMPCFCVGPRTAEKARAFGFRDVHASMGDGAELAQFIHGALAPKKTTILHLAGRDIDAKAHQELQKLGRRIVDWVVYEAVPVGGLTQATRQRLEQHKLDAVLLFSQRTAETWRSLVAEAGLEACCGTLAAICLSAAIAENLKPLAWRQLAFAPLATEDAVIARLKEICPVET